MANTIAANKAELLAIANAVAAASLESDGRLSLKALGNSTLQAGSATSINVSGGMFAESDAGAFVRSNNDAVDINIGQDFMITGGTAIATGTAGHFRITSGSPTDVAGMQGVIETTGGSPTGDMGLDNTSISSGATTLPACVVMTTWPLYRPALALTLAETQPT